MKNFATHTLLPLVLVIASASAFSFLITGCNPVAASKAAEAGVTEFHKNFNAGDFEKIYDDSHPDFKASTSKKDAVDFIASMKAALGEVTAASKTGWNISSTAADGTTVDLTYSTTYTGGTATESFVYKLENGVATLLSWNIQGTPTAPAAAAAAPTVTPEAEPASPVVEAPVPGSAE
jgi:hypothetical protein